MCFTLGNKRVILCLNLACSNLYGGMRGGWSQTHTAVFNPFNCFIFHSSLLSGDYAFLTIVMKNIVLWCPGNTSGIYWKNAATLIMQMQSPDIYKWHISVSRRLSSQQTTYLELDDQLACVLMHLRAYLLFYLQNEKGGRGGELDSSKPAVPSQWGCRQLGAHYS